MTHSDKVKYLRIALALQNIGVSDETSDRIISTYEAVLKKGGDFSIDDACDIQFSLDKKYIKEELEK